MARQGFQAFADSVKSGIYEPARSNLYEVRIPLPQCIWMNEPMMRSKQTKLAMGIDMLADVVTVPGRRVTTQQVKDVGQQRNYATGQVSNQFSAEFIITKDMMHQEYFDRWMNYTASDAENRVTFYDEYITNIMVLKWELASSVVVDHSTPECPFNHTRLNRTSAVWQMYGAFPTDMSEHSFSNAQADLVKLNVSFKYERMRFDTVMNDVLPWKAETPDTTVYNLGGMPEVADILGLNMAQPDASNFS